MKWFLLGMAGCVFLAAGCGSDDDPGSKASGGTAGSAAGASGSGGGAGSSGQAGSGGAGGSSGAGPSQPTPEETAACEKVNRAFCQKLEECDQRMALSFASVDDCVANRAPFCAEYDFADGSNLSVDVAGACAASYAALDCTGLEDLFGPNAAPPSGCPQTPGDLEDEARCVSPSQCKSFSCFSAFSAGRACGLCLPRGNENEACVNSNACASGLACVSQKCVPVAELDADCDFGRAPCKGSLWCIAGKCGQPLAENADCQVGSFDCDLYQALICNQTSAKCEKMVGGAALGDKCGFVAASGDLVSCALDLRCELPAQSFEGTCVAASKLGEACFTEFFPLGGASRSNYSSCEPNLECVEDVCVEMNRHRCGP